MLKTLKLSSAIMALSLLLTMAVACGPEPSPTPTPTPTATVSNTELEGSWTGEASWHGNTSPIYTFTCNGSNFTYTCDTGIEGSGTFAIDTAANPKTIDLYITEHTTPAFSGKTCLGVYEVIGTTLTIAMAEPPGTTPRPISLTDGMIYTLVKQ